MSVCACGCACDCVFVTLQVFACDGRHVRTRARVPGWACRCVCVRTCARACALAPSCSKTLHLGAWQRCQRQSMAVPAMSDYGGPFGPVPDAPLLKQLGRGYLGSSFFDTQSVSGLTCLQRLVGLRRDGSPVFRCVSCLQVALRSTSCTLVAWWVVLVVFLVCFFAHQSVFLLSATLRDGYQQSTSRSVFHLRVVLLAPLRGGSSTYPSARPGASGFLVFQMWSSRRSWSIRFGSVLGCCPRRPTVTWVASCFLVGVWPAETQIGPCLVRFGLLLLRFFSDPDLESGPTQTRRPGRADTQTRASTQTPGPARVQLAPLHLFLTDSGIYHLVLSGAAGLQADFRNT